VSHGGKWRDFLRSRNRDTYRSWLHSFVRLSFHSVLDSRYDESFFAFLEMYAIFMASITREKILVPNRIIVNQFGQKKTAAPVKAVNIE
jgi:hypothetical protein